MLNPVSIIRIQCIFNILISAILYLYPEYVLSFVIRPKTDGVHWHMARCPASVLIAASTMSCYWSKSTDFSARTATFIFNIMFGALAIASSWSAKVFASEYVFGQTLTGVIIYFVISIIINVYCLLRLGWPIGRIEFEPDRQKVPNRLFIMDSYAAFIIGILWIAFPDLILRRQIQFPLTQHHVYVCRIFGCVLASSSILGANAVYLKNASDRAVGLATRFVANALVLISQLHCQYAYGQWWRHTHWVGMTLCTFWMGIVGFVLINVYRGKWR